MEQWTLGNLTNKFFLRVTVFHGTLVWTAVNCEERDYEEGIERDVNKFEWAIIAVSCKINEWREEKGN